MYVHRQSTAFSCTMCTQQSKKVVRGKLKGVHELCWMPIFLLALHQALHLQLTPPQKDSMKFGKGLSGLGQLCLWLHVDSQLRTQRGKTNQNKKKNPKNPRRSVAESDERTAHSHSAFLSKVRSPFSSCALPLPRSSPASPRTPALVLSLPGCIPTRAWTEPL